MSNKTNNKNTSPPSASLCAFAGHVVELAEQSENKTLNVFSQVYRRMEPLSRMLIQQLYTEIIKYVVFVCVA